MCAPNPKIRRNCPETGTRAATPDQSASFGYAPRYRVSLSKGRYGRYCSNLSRRPTAGKICLSLTSRAVSSNRQKRRLQQDPPQLRGPGRRSVRTIAQQPPRSGTGQSEKRWYRFAHASKAVRHTEASAHENFAEEQARWERSDPAYARICDKVRHAPNQGEEASRRADEVKAEWDARVAPQRQANDDAEKANHASKLKADPTARRPSPTSQAALNAQRSLPATNRTSNPNTHDRLHAAPDRSRLPDRSPPKSPTP